MAVIDFFNRQTEQPAGEQRIGIGGFKMLARTRQTFTYTSQAPTAYLEDGSFASDHIVLDPLTLVIDGVVSDVYQAPFEQSPLLRQVQSTVGQFTGFLPGRTATQVQRIANLAVSVSDRARQSDSLISNGSQVLNLFGDQTQSKSLQAQFVDAMESLHYGKQLIAIEMPYRRFDDMRITSISFTKDNRTDAIQFSLSAQKVRKTETFFAQVEQVTGGAGGRDPANSGDPASNPAPGLGGQTQGETDKGAQEGSERPRSILSGIFG